MPLDDAGANEALAIEDPAEFAAGLFRRLLEKRGIVIYGISVRATPNWPRFPLSAGPPSRHRMEAAMASACPEARSADHAGQLRIEAAATGYSRDQQVSQNLHAELLLRLLGRERGNAGTIEGGLEVLRGFLTQAGSRATSTFFTTDRDFRGKTGGSPCHCSAAALLLDAALGSRL